MAYDALSDLPAGQALATAHVPVHAALKANLETVQDALGVVSDTPTLGKQLRATGTGTTAWTGFTEVVLRAAGAGQDDAAAFRAAVAAATGPTVFLLPDDKYEFRTVDDDNRAVAIDKDNIFFRGKGRTKVNAGVDPATGGTTAIVARSTVASGGIMFCWFADEGANTSDNSDETIGGGLHDLSVSGESGALRALEIQAGCVGQRFTNAHMAHCTEEVVLGGSGCTHSGDIHTWHTTHDIVFDHCTIRAFGTSDAVRYQGNPNVAGGENSFDWTFRSCNVSAVNGYAHNAIDCDDIFLYGGAHSVSGTGQALLLAAGTATKGSGGRAFQTQSVFGGMSNQVLAKGGVTSTRSSRGALIIGASTEDVTGRPTMEPGAHLFLLDNNGRHNLVPDLRMHMPPLTDDFILGTTTSGAIGDLRWYLSAGTVTQVAAEADHMGIIRLATGASSGTLAAMSTSASTSAGAILPAESFDAQFMFRLGQADSDTVCRIGLAMAYTSDPPDNGVYIELLGSSNLVWQARSRVASSNTTTGTATTATTDWVRLRIKRRNDTEIGFSFGDTTNEQDTWVVAACPTVALNPFIQIKTLADADKTIDIDAFQVFVNGLDR